MLMFFVYVVVTALLAWWPWNLILIAFGAAYTAGLYRREIRGLFAGNAGDPPVGCPQGVEQATIARNDLDAFRKLTEVT